MKLTSFLIWSFALCIAGTVGAAAGVSPLPVSLPLKEGLSEARLARLESFMRSTIDSGDYHGAVTLIARNGKIVDWRTYGHRDLAKKTPMTRDSIFRIYSMTKTVTSVAVLMLMEEGKFGLDDPIAKYLPEFASTQVFSGGTADAPQLRPARQPLTIRHLLTHTSGIATRDAKNGEAVKRFNRIELNALPTLAAYAKYVAGEALARDPGEVFTYDGVPLVVLSRLVEVVSGMPFEEFLRQKLFVPLTMKDTGFTVPPRDRARIVDMVTTTPEGRLVKTTSKDAQYPGESLNPYPSGAGGLYSTAADYVRFCQMLLNGGSLDRASILGRKTVELMIMNHLTHLDPPVNEFSNAEGFGLGGYVVLDVARRGRLGSVGQFGWSGAGSTYFTIDPREKLIAILLMQHLPQGLAKDPPKISGKFYNFVYQSLVNEMDSSRP
jgi:CubicO group peptidase (beta-lactamase class C family)